MKTFIFILVESWRRTAELLCIRENQMEIDYQRCVRFQRALSLWSMMMIDKALNTTITDFVNPLKGRGVN